MRPNQWTTRIVAAGLWLAPMVEYLRLVVPRPAQIDDAYISYRYAANWVAGLGLVWNPGEFVEGISNPLWTALVAAGLAVGGDAEAIGHALGVSGGVALLVGTVALARAWLPEETRWLAPLAIWPIAGSTTLVYWSTAGLETTLVAAFVVWAFVASGHRRHGWMSGCLALATLTRMDAALAAVVLFGFQLWRQRRGGLAALGPGLAYGAVLGIALAARFFYYGALLPNTYWAKVGGVPLLFGLAYVGKFLAAGALFLIPTATFALARDRATWPAGVYVALAIAYAIWIGGDAFPFSRFLLVAWPLLSALAIVGLIAAWRQQWLIGAALTPMLALAIAWPIWIGTLPGFEAFGAPPRDAALAAEWRHAAHMVDLQKRRRDLLRREPEPGLVAAGAIGALGYFTGLPVLDILGLTDPHIAHHRVGDRTDGLPIPGHARSDADYVFAARPDFLFVPKRGTGPVWIFALQDIWAHPDLDRFYVWDAALEGYRRSVPASEDGGVGGGASGR